MNFKFGFLVFFVLFAGPFLLAADSGLKTYDVSLKQNEIAPENGNIVYLEERLYVDSVKVVVESVGKFGAASVTVNGKKVSMVAASGSDKAVEFNISIKEATDHIFFTGQAGSKDFPFGTLKIKSFQLKYKKEAAEVTEKGKKTESPKEAPAPNETAKCKYIYNISSIIKGPFANRGAGGEEAVPTTITGDTKWFTEETILEALTTACRACDPGVVDKPAFEGSTFNTRTTRACGSPSCIVGGKAVDDATVQKFHAMTICGGKGVVAPQPLRDTGKAEAFYSEQREHQRNIEDIKRKGDARIQEILSSMKEEKPRALQSAPFVPFRNSVLPTKGW